MAETTFNGITYKSKKKMRIEESKKILSNYSEPLTLRQLYYRFVTKGYPNKRSQYVGLSKALVEARLENEIPFDALEDRQRETVGGDYSSIGPEELLESKLSDLQDLHYQYRRPHWENQSYYVEVWVEKEALSRIFESTCDPLCVKTYAGKGYSSLTAEYEAVKRFNDNSKENVILYFGDFDPSGKDIERDFTEKLQEKFGISIQVNRIALTKKQIDEMELPPQPAKSSDTRYQDFVEKHGDMAVELDAIEPDQLENMIEDAVNDYFDSDIYKQVREQEKKDRQKIREKINKMDLKKIIN